MGEYFEIFHRIFNFIFSVMSIPVLGNASILDITTFGIISMAITRLIFLPVFGKNGGFGSSSVEKARNRRIKKNKNDT